MKQQGKAAKSSSMKRLLVAGVVALAAGSLFVTSHLAQSKTAEEVMKGPFVTTEMVEMAPTSFAQLAQSLSPTVVNVKVTSVAPADFDGHGFQEGPFGEFFDRFFEHMPRNPKGHRSQGAGSGVIISSDGYILSNNHVVEHAQEITVTLDNEKQYPAEIVGRDPKTDLAVLKIDTGDTLPAAALGSSDEIRVGDWVMAIGNPFGLNHTVTSGIVSAKGRVIGAGPYDDFIQTDASINPGNSGGPLFNMKGEVVGINTAIIPQGQNIGFAIPVDMAKPLIPQLVNDGHITRGYIGVNIQTLTPELAEAMAIDEAAGALVTDVTKDSPAEKAGIERGDIITNFGGAGIEDSHDLPAVVAATPVNEEVEVIVMRDGAEKSLMITVGKLAGDDIEVAGADDSAKGKWGMQLHELDESITKQFDVKGEQGVVVVGVEPGSPAEEAGIRPGDVIIEVNRQSVDSIGAVKDQIATADDKERLLLLIERQGGKIYVPLARQVG
ncbi:MAG: Do family serine endopeptidase [Desulfofustis sp. PB-SRB1]|jgi:serine protease Do|nr:Do family serine endopeptidase [Desulfofustis sp. PB-SRB1]HBH30109.1 peptidase [Desulfofustis sp.]HBH31013.1 peptidase [Desulfofustis sp.]